MKIGRNDICICGSGKKYKYCCLNKKNDKDEDISDLVNSKVNEFRIKYNLILDEKPDSSKDYIIKLYDKIHSEILEIKKYNNDCIDLINFEKAILNYFVATYYSNLSVLYHDYRTLLIITNKIEKGITFGDNNEFVGTSSDNEYQMYNKKFELSEKSNKHFVLAQNAIDNVINKNDNRVVQQNVHISINSFNNLSTITPLLTILLIENFETSYERELDFYSKSMLSISYMHAFKQYLKYLNNGFESLRSVLKQNCTCRLNRVVYDLTNAYSVHPEDTDDTIKSILAYINAHIDDKIKIEDLANKDINALELSSTIISSSYEYIKDKAVESMALNLFGQISCLHIIWNELCENMQAYGTISDTLEKLYKVSQAYNIIDKISYALIEYTGTNKIPEKEWGFDTLLKSKLLADYNEPNFRQVIAFTQILSNFNNRSYFKEFKDIVQIRHDITHKPIDIDLFEHGDTLDRLKKKIDIYNISYFILASSAIEIDMRENE